MLANPKASSLVTSFAMKWLNLTTLDSVQPDPKLFPVFNERCGTISRKRRRLSSAASYWKTAA